jgi:hypothetical protein
VKRVTDARPGVARVPHLMLDARRDIERVSPASNLRSALFTRVTMLPSRTSKCSDCLG